MESYKVINLQSTNDESPAFRYALPIITDKENPNLSSNVHPMCCGCGHVIQDATFLLVDFAHWHVACLKCCACAKSLDGALSCFVKDGRIFCREDYKRYFTFRPCAYCGVLVESHEWVMKVRNRVYHATKRCFSCCVCQRPLVSGERYLDDMKGLVCISCAEMNDDFYGTLQNKPGRPRKKKLNVTSTHLDSICGMSISFTADESLALGGGSPSYQAPKSKRMRTSFKHHQLRSMKAYFHHNHNPDAKDLKQLSQETGLTKRVLQVWFQNARAKYRRSCAQDGKDKPKDDTNKQKSSQIRCDETKEFDDSPNSGSFIYETNSHCDELSPCDDFQQHSYLSYNNKVFVGSMTSLSTASPSSPVSSALESA